MRKKGGSKKGKVCYRMRKSIIMTEKVRERMKGWGKVIRNEKERKLESEKEQDWERITNSKKEREGLRKKVINREKWWIRRTSKKVKNEKYKEITIEKRNKC